MNTIMRVWLTPIRILLFFLLGLNVLASWSWGGWEVGFWVGQFRNFLLLVLGFSVVYYPLLQRKLIQATRLEYHLITSSILFLLFDPLLPWWVFVSLGVMTEVIQRFVRVPTGPVFNPAAMGALLMSLMGYFPGWWGTSFAPRLPLLEGGVSVVVFLTIPIAGYVAQKYRKLNISLAAWVMFGMLYLGLFGTNPLFLLFEGTLFFFLLVMAVEPKTTPVLPKEQLIFGALVGGLSVVLLRIYFFEPYCGALVIANGLFNAYRHRKWVMGKIVKPPEKSLPGVSESRVISSQIV